MLPDSAPNAIWNAIALRQKVTAPPALPSGGVFRKVTKGNSMTTSRLATSCLLLATLILGGCGGGGSATSNCTIGSATGCGGTFTPPTPVAPPVVLPTPVDPSTLAAAVNLVASSNELPSAGTTEVMLTALVRSGDNNALAGATVSFAADSGLLTVNSTQTDKSGKATAMLGTGGSAANRSIKVTVRVGSQVSEAQVQVVGTTVTLSGAASALAGSALDLVATVRDSAGRPLAGAPLTLASSLGNVFSVANGTSDSQGLLALQLQAKQRGTDTLTLSALGATASKAVAISGIDLRVLPAISVDTAGAEQLQQASIGSCQVIDGRYEIGGVAQGGMLTLATSRGKLYSDVGCTLPVIGSRALINGNFPPTYIKHDTASIATITAAVGTAATSLTRIEFVAPLTGMATVTLQPELSTIGSGDQTTLVAMVRDGTAINNVVKGATVQFAILADPSGGNLTAPFSAVTGSDGTARVLYTGGAGDTGNGGAVLEARLASLPAAVSTTHITVSKKSLSVQIGRGNSLKEYSSTILQEDFAVFVADAAGAGVPGVNISASAWPIAFTTGGMQWFPDSATAKQPGRWLVSEPSFTCPNEDVMRRGIFNASLDYNGNGQLDPGIPLSVVSSGKTDALGIVTVSLRYPRDRAHWVRVELKVNGQAYGTESTARTIFTLAGLAKDYIDFNTSPPGLTSPYGTGPCR
jgi:hypothetical protein